MSCIIKVSNIKSKITGLAPSYLNLLAQELAVKVPNYYFSPAFKSGRWDGKQHFLARPANTFPTGLLPKVVSFLIDTCETTPKLEDYRENLDDLCLPNIDPGYVIGENKILRQYQVDAINKIADNKVLGIPFQRGVINIATNGGKTVIAEGVISELYPQLRKCNGVFLFATHSKEIAHQAHQVIGNDLQIDVGFIGDGQWDVKTVTVAIITTVYRRMKDGKSEFDELRERVRGAVVDECLPGTSQVLLPGNKKMSIKDVCERDDITEVVSFNLEKKVFEVKPILRKIVTPVTNPFWKIWYRNPVTQQMEGLMATPNHKIWTSNRGYVRVDELQLGDTIKVNTSNPEPYFRPHGKFQCSFCGKVLDSLMGLGGHVNMLHSPNREQTIRKRAETRHRKYQSGEIVTSFRQRQSSSIWMKEYNSRSEVKEASSIRCKTVLATDNDIKKKRVDSWRKNWESNPEWRNSQLTRFKNASLYKSGAKTSLEEWVLSLGIPEIQYTGDGSVWFTFSEDYHAKYNKRHKNPDFLIKLGNDKKVIEVGDITYWHSMEEIADVTLEYEKLGYQCLYLTSQDIQNTPQDTAERVRKFVYNHEVQILKISQNVKGRRSPFKYNLEIADNHNYFANNVLVSNCHHAQSVSWQDVLNQFDKASIRLGLTGTVDKKNPLNEMKLYACTGNILTKISNDFLIHNGVSAKPICIMFQVDKPELGGMEYQDAYRYGIVENEIRHDIIYDICAKETAASNTVLILVERIEHGQYLEEVLKPLCKEVYFTNGQLSSDERVSLLDKLRNGELDVLISSNILDEGVDVSGINAIVYARGMKSMRKLLQGIGRGLRLKDDNSKLRFYDFIDDTHIKLLQHSQERYETLAAEKFVVKLMDIQSYNSASWDEINKEE